MFNILQVVYIIGTLLKTQRTRIKRFNIILLCVYGTLKIEVKFLKIGVQNKIFKVVQAQVLK